MTYTITKSCSDDKTKPQNEEECGEELIQEPYARKANKKKEAELFTTTNHRCKKGRTHPTRGTSSLLLHPLGRGPARSSGSRGSAQQAGAARRSCCRCCWWSCTGSSKRTWQGVGKGKVGQFWLLPSPCWPLHPHLPGTPRAGVPYMHVFQPQYELHGPRRKWLRRWAFLIQFYYHIFYH